MRRRQCVLALGSAAVPLLAGCTSILTSTGEIRTTETHIDTTREPIGVATTVVCPSGMPTQDIGVRFQLLGDGSMIAEAERRIRVSGGDEIPVVMRFEGVSGAERDRVEEGRAEVFEIDA